MSARQLDRARRIFQRGAAVLALLGLRHVAVLLLELLDDVVLQPDLVDLLQELALAGGDLLVGDLFFVEDDELAHGALAPAQLLAHLDDFVRDLAASSRST